MGFAVSLYKKYLCRRYDNPGYLLYFTAADFPGLTAEPVEFPSGENILRGFFYAYPDHGDNLVVFCHGIGGGHLSYTREIERLCREGYTVLAYDNTGCFSSGGDGIGGLSASLRDLDAALTWLAASGRGKAFRHLYAVGHSWGGYAAGNIPAFHPEVEKCVVLSGFLSVETLLRALTAKVKLPLKSALIRKLLAYEKEVAPRHYDAFMPDAVRGNAAKYFFIHDKNDPTVPFEANTGELRRRFPKAKFLVTTNRFHNPNYTPDAAKRLAGTFGEFNRLVKKKKLRTLEQKQAYFADADWSAMTEQDENVWKKIFSFLKK